MDERSFVSEKQESWDRLSRSLEQMRMRGARSLSREQLASLGSGYRAVVSDLAFARSQGGSERLVAYLNDLAGQAHGMLYASKSAKLYGATTFLVREFPALFRSTFRYTLVAFLLFVAGWLTAAYVIYSIPDSWNALIPEQFREATDTPRSGKPEAMKTIFIGIDPADMSSRIMTNNIKEGMKAFAGGVTFGIATVLVLFWNGLVIGAIITIIGRVAGLQMLLPLLLPHGIIELMAVFICGGGGLLVGSAMIAPGNVRRADAMRIAAAKALRLFAGALPMFVVAATIEGFITPAAIPNFAKLAFAGVTAIGLAMYLGFAGSGAVSRRPSANG